MERTLVSGKTKIKVRASILAIWFYRVAFRSDMTAAASRLVYACGKLDGFKDAPVVLEAIASLKNEALRIMWAMAKAAAFARGDVTASFCEWADAYGGIKLVDILPNLIALIAEGFYSSIKITGNNQRSKPVKYNDSFIAASCKSMNLTYEEMNEMTLHAYIEFANASAGEDDGRPQKMSPAQISEFFKN